MFKNKSQLKCVCLSYILLFNDHAKRFKMFGIFFFCIAGDKQYAVIKYHFKHTNTQNVFYTYVVQSVFFLLIKFFFKYIIN